MSIALAPHALEGYVKMELENAADTVAQLQGGKHPEYDDRCREVLGEYLLGIVRAREEQVALDPSYDVGGLLHVEGLSEDLLHDGLRLGDLRRIRVFIQL